MAVLLPDVAFNWRQSTHRRGEVGGYDRKCRFQQVQSEGIPQGLKSIDSIGFIAKAEALAYLEAKAMQLSKKSSAPYSALRGCRRLLPGALS